MDFCLMHNNTKYIHIALNKQEMERGSTGPVQRSHYIVIRITSVIIHYMHHSILRSSQGSKFAMSRVTHDTPLSVSVLTRQCTAG